MAEALQHITLTTGHVRPSPRSEVSDDVIASLRSGLLRTGRAELAGLLLRLEPAQHAGGRLFTISAGDAVAPGPARGAPAVSCVCCWSAEHACNWWALATAINPCDAAQPQLPWLAVALHPALAALPRDVTGLLGDAERCVAWALIDAG